MTALYMKNWRWPAWLLAAALALTLLPLTSPPQAANAGPGIEPRFAEYYTSHEGIRVLGYPVTGLVEVEGYAAQYFEKGRIEDHRAGSVNPNWQFMYGRLTAELMRDAPGLSVSGTNYTYGELVLANEERFRVHTPQGFTGGTQRLSDGMFVPFDPQLRPARGYVIPFNFWIYINRADLFPGGWLHDIGLPMTHPFDARLVESGWERYVTVQAFERAVLTYNSRNPAGWEVEKGNIGADAASTLPSNTQAELQVPVEGARVMLPLHILARVGNAGDTVTAELRWQDGTRLTDKYTLLRGEDGRGLLVGNLDWVNMLQPPAPATQRAALEIRSAAGVVLAHRDLVVVSPRDPGTREIKVYWTVSGAEVVTPQTRRVLQTEGIATAALEELLWGPPKISQVGFRTSLPTPEQVLAYPGRTPDWGPRVTLRELTIVNGVATVDFSKELRAYGGGSLRVAMIYDQISMTLKQFPGVREVRVAIEGQTDGVLEP